MYTFSEYGDNDSCDDIRHNCNDNGNDDDHANYTDNCDSYNDIDDNNDEIDGDDNDQAAACYRSCVYIHSSLYNIHI